MGVISKDSLKMVQRKLLQALLLVSVAIIQIYGEGCETEKDKQCLFPFKTTCITTAGDKCKFPFTYKNGKKYTGCTTDDMSGGKLWCSTETDKFGVHINGKFGYCIEEVCKEPIVTQTHSACVPATNKGSEGKGWCATTVTPEEGIFDSWDYCKEPTCGGAASGPLMGCLVCGVGNSALWCYLNGTEADVATNFLESFRVGCLWSNCLCALVPSLKPYLALIGLCVR